MGKDSKSIPKSVKAYLSKNYPKPETKRVGAGELDNLNLLTPIVIDCTSTRQGDSTNERIGAQIQSMGLKLKMFLHNGSTSPYHVRMILVEHTDYSANIDVSTPLYMKYDFGTTPTYAYFNSSQANLVQNVNRALFTVIYDKLFYLSADGVNGSDYIKFNKWISYKRKLQYQLPGDRDPRKGRLSLVFQVYDADGNGIVEPTGINCGIGAILYYTDV